MDIDNIVNQIKDGVVALAKNTVKDFITEAKSDAEDFLQESRDNLKRWSEAAAEGKLTKAEFEFLLQMQVGLGKMHALTAAGEARLRIDRFRQGLISLVIKTVFAAV